MKRDHETEYEHIYTSHTKTAVELKASLSLCLGEIVRPGGTFALNRNKSESLKCHYCVVYYVCFL